MAIIGICIGEILSWVSVSDWYVFLFIGETLVDRHLCECVCVCRFLVDHI